MEEINNILSRIDQINKENALLDDTIKEHCRQTDKKIDACKKTSQIIDDAEREFKSLTSIFNKKDLTFFVFTLLLLGGYKALIKILREMKDTELAKKTPFHNEEHSNRSNNRYYCTREEIAVNPVPFDAIHRTQDTEWFSSLDGGIPGFNGFNHRAKALGHDPLLGLIFGTANIMTSTITRNDFCSWHVVTHGHERTYKSGIKTIFLDSIAEPASTIEIFTSIGERLSSEGKDGWMTLGCALLKEVVHLLSDINSRQSLPLPILPVFSEKLARELSLYGLNFGTIAQGGLASITINFVMAFLHRLCRTQGEDEEMYKVRTRKIILYANTLATFSDIAYTLFLAYIGDKNALRKFDLGGAMVGCYQICHSVSVIKTIEAEFIMSKVLESIEQANE